MNVLDENIPEDQRQLLRSWRIRVRQIGHEIGRQGMKDDEIIPLLHQFRRPTFFTRDAGFFDRRLRHPRHCLTYLDVTRHESASAIRRFLQHPEFDTQAKRIGLVVRISRRGIHLWRRSGEEALATWPN